MAKSKSGLKFPKIEVCPRCLTFERYLLEKKLVKDFEDWKTERRSKFINACLKLMEEDLCKEETDGGLEDE